MAQSRGARHLRVRADAWRLSHAELDAATDLNRGDIAELAELYAALEVTLDLRVVGGCCGTDHEHISVIASRVLVPGGGPYEDTRAG